MFSGGIPIIWDRFLADATTGQLWVDMSPAERASATIGDNLVWIGPKIYAPTTYQGGSGLHHFDEGTCGSYFDPGELMTPFSGGPGGEGAPDS